MIKRYLKVRFVHPGEPVPRATRTYINQIPKDAWNEIINWALTGQGDFGKAKKFLTINIIVSRNKNFLRKKEASK